MKYIGDYYLHLEIFALEFCAFAVDKLHILFPSFSSSKKKNPQQNGKDKDCLGPKQIDSKMQILQIAQAF